MRLLPIRWVIFTCIVLVSSARAQEVRPTPAESPDIGPSWESQKEVAGYALSNPAPGGKIPDRYGQPLAQNRVSDNLSIVFPTPLDFTDQQIIQYVERQISLAKTLTSRPINWSTEGAIQHYRNRGVIPFDIAIDLSQTEVQSLKKNLPEGLTLRATYVRLYPQGHLAGHVVGYTGRTSGSHTKPLPNPHHPSPATPRRHALKLPSHSHLQRKL